MTLFDALDIIVGGQTYRYAKAGPSTPHPTVQVLWLSEDVIVHNGLCDPPAGVAPAHIGPHIVRLFFNSAQVGADINVPYLLWHSEYGFDLVADTVLRSPQDLYTQRLTLPMGPLVKGHMPAPFKSVYGGPESLDGVLAYMATTGQNADIGLATEASADYFFYGDPAPVCAMTKGLRPFASFVMDERTGGKIFDKIKNPKATTYAGQNNFKPGQPGYISPSPANPVPLPANWPVWDPAHTPEAYFAFCITGRMRYLRILQAYANQAVLWTALKNFNNPFEPSVAISQERVFGWGQRQAHHARRATELAEAAGQNLAEYGLMPSSYFKTIADNGIAMMRKFYMGDPAIQIFGFAPHTGYVSPWMQDYTGQVLGENVFLYPGEIDDFYLWDFKNVMDRVSGKTGWPPCTPSAYRINLGNFSITALPPPFTLKTTDFLPDWGAAWASEIDPTKYGTDGLFVRPQDFAAAKADQYNGDVWASPNVDYPQQVLARLSIAMLLDGQGILKVSATYPDLPAAYAHQFKMLTNWLAQSPSNTVPARVSLLPNPPGSFPNPVLPPAPPPPPVQPPPITLPPVVPPLPATIPGIASRVDNLKTIVGVP